MRTITYEEGTDGNGKKFPKNMLKELKDLAERDFGLGLERISTYPPGIELKVFCSSDITENEFKRKGLIAPMPGREITIYSPAEGLYISPIKNGVSPMEFFSLNGSRIRLATKYKTKTGELRDLVYHIEWRSKNGK